MKIGTSINVDAGAPYTSVYDAKGLSNGTHTLTAEAKDQFGRSSKATLTINVAKESAAPADVKNVTVVPAVGQAQLTWTNPSDSDLSRVRIYISESAGSLGLRYSSEIVVTPGSTSTTSIGGLSSGKTYYFTIRPVDTNNNENQSTTQYSTLIP